MTMTPERIAELDAVMAKATAGEWRLRFHPSDANDFIVQAPRLRPDHPYDIQILTDD